MSVSRRVPQPIRIAIRSLSRCALSALPRLGTSVNGELAINGGRPIRDLRIRPWASVSDTKLVEWHSGARAALRRVSLSGIEGLPQPLANSFADEWARFCGCRYGLLLGHGTDAIRISLAAALDHDGLDYGGEIIVPNFSFIASATAALDRRFGVSFVDVDADTLLIDPLRVEEAIVPGRTRAILPVHLFGQPADMTSLREIADKHDLKIIEDAAQAHGAVWESGPAGSLGHAAAFSFQSSKNLSCGEGGALVTNDYRLFELAHSMHNAGRAMIGGARWEHFELGWNCRITEYQAAILTNRFKRFAQDQDVRRGRFVYLRELMRRNVTAVEPLLVDGRVRSHGMHMFAMRYKTNACGGVTLDRFLDLVRAEGAPINRAFPMTVSSQPAIKRLMQRRPEYFTKNPTPVADGAAEDTLYIPHEVFLGSRADMDDIVAALIKVQNYCS